MNFLASLQSGSEQDILNLVVRFLINFAIVFILIRGLYYNRTKRDEYAFSFILLGNIIFWVIFLLSSIQLQVGFALGLFAIFGIIRYRTNPIPIREMTYLFSTIGLSVINATSSQNLSFTSLLFANISCLLIVYSLEYIWLKNRLSCKKINYERIDLIVPEKRGELLQDLKTRTGLNIKRIEIGTINFLNDTAKILIYYESEEKNNLLEELEINNPS